MTEIGYINIIRKFKNALINMDRNTRVSVLNQMTTTLLGDSSHIWIQELFMIAQHSSDQEFISHYAWFGASNHKHSRKLLEMIFEILKYSTGSNISLPPEPVPVPAPALPPQGVSTPMAEPVPAPAPALPPQGVSTPMAAPAEPIQNHALAKNKEFQKWINSGAYNASGVYNPLQQFGIKYWSQSELEIEFWKYMSEVGFAKCPTCEKQPHINRYVTMCYAGKQIYSMQNGLFPNHYMGGGDYIGWGSSVIKTLSCCEHLYDFEKRRRYIKVSALKYCNSPKVKYDICVPIRDCYGKYEMKYNADGMPEYALYNSADPDGSLALSAYQTKIKTERITTLQKELEELHAQ
jgi:hypothetical protein